MPDQSKGEKGGRGSASGRYPGEYSVSADNDNGYYQYKKDPDEIALKNLLLMVWRRKWTVLLITILGAGLAAWYAFSQLPVYQSQGTLLITESQQRVGNSGDLQNLLATSYGFGLGSRISNEMYVLHSRQLSLNLADRLLEEQTMEDGNMFPLLYTAYPDDPTVDSRGAIASKIRNKLDAERGELESDLIFITFRSFSPYEAKWVVDQAIDGYRELSTEQNRMAANAALEFLDDERSRIALKLNETEETLQDFMQNTGLVQIDSQTGRVIDRISDLESRRQEIQTRHVAVESALATYERQLDQIRPGLADRYAESVAPTMERYQFRLAELETERLLYITRNPSLRLNPEQEPDLVRINDQIDLLKQEINSLASQMMGDEGQDEFLSFLTSSDGNIASRITDLRNRMIELQVEQTQFLAQQQAIEERLQIEESFFDGLPENMVELARHRRDVQINESLYETISRQYAETTLWVQTQFGHGRPVDYGYLSGIPVEPNIPMLLIMGILFGGVMGVGIAISRETLNWRLDGVQKLREMGFPVLSVVPDFSKYLKKRYKGAETVRLDDADISTSWITMLNALSPAAESFRRLHNNIIYSHPDEQLNTILITSSTQGEGKTTVAANLASVLAESGNSVLLLDMDLRKPRMHKMAGINQSPGLIDVLFDDLPLTEAIRKTSVNGVHVLTTGKKAPNPNAVTQSKKLTDTFYELRRLYNYIIIDTAPYGIISDSAPMIRLADGVVVVSRFNQTDTRELAQTIEALENIHANIVGTVLTAYRHKTSTDSYNSGHYRYPYYYNQKGYELYNEEPEKVKRKKTEKKEGGLF